MEYPAVVSAVGGRRGRVWTESSSIDSQVKPPGGAGHGATPEEFLAAAWASCYGSAYAFEARRAGISTDAEFHAKVVLDVNEGAYNITRAELTVATGHEDQDVVDAVAKRAHARCPMSKVLADGISAVRVGVEKTQRSRN